MAFEQTDWHSLVDHLHVRPMLKSCDAGCSLLKLIGKVAGSNNQASGLSDTEWSVATLLLCSKLLQEKVTSRIKQKRWEWLGYSVDNTVQVDMKSIQNLPAIVAGIDNNPVTIYDFWAVIPAHPKHQASMWHLLTRTVSNVLVSTGPTNVSPTPSVHPKKRALPATPPPPPAKIPHVTTTDHPTRVDMGVQTTDELCCICVRPMLLPLPIFEEHVDVEMRHK